MVSGGSLLARRGLPDNGNAQQGIAQGQHVRSGSGTLRREEKRWKERGEEMGKVLETDPYLSCGERTTEGCTM